jgi:hypothetical protein
MEEVSQLWTDIMDAMEEGRSEYFLGTIVVTEDREERTRSVIDGQQRLATLTMMLAAIRSVYEEHGDDRADEVYSTYLGVRDRRSRLTARLTLNRTNAATFQELVVEHVPPQRLADAKRNKNYAPSNQLLIKAADFIRTALAERIRQAGQYDRFVLDLEDYIKDRLVLILVAVGDEADAYLIFETLNDRGLDLSISDLLKNYIYGRAWNRLAQVQTQWEEMMVLLGTQDATQFLRHYWLSRYGVVRERDLYRELRSKFSSPERVLSLMSELRDSSDKYAALSNVDHPIWRGQPTKLRHDLETLQLFGLSQFRPLLLAALDGLHDRDVILKLLRILVVISVRYSIIGSLGTGNMEKAYSDAAIDVRKGKADTVPKIFSILKPVIYPNDAQFQSDFAEKSITKSKLARYLLTTVANARQPQQELAVLEDEREVTLEHIMPKTPSEYWRDVAYDEAQYLAYVDRLGNMTLIEESANRAAGNASFERKQREAFGQSDIVITKELCRYNRWTVQEIEKRQQELAITAVSVWNVPY